MVSKTWIVTYRWAGHKSSHTFAHETDAKAFASMMRKRGVKVSCGPYFKV